MTADGRSRSERASDWSSAENVTDSERLYEALRQIRGVTVDAATIRAHVMRPANVLDVTSDRGLGVERPPTPAKPVDGGLPEEFLGFAFNVDGFVETLQAAFDNSVAGYAMGLNKSGQTLRRLDWGWAHEPQDTAESWTPDVRQHVASLSKQPTAMAMIRALNEAGLTSKTPIIDYLPDYWVKGQNVDQITFANLLTNTSGLAYGIDTSASDFEFMKASDRGWCYRSGEVVVPEHELRSVPDPDRDGRRQRPAGLSVPPHSRSAQLHRQGSGTWSR